MELNAIDNGKRRYILCQLDEPVKADSEAKRAGYDTIDQIARERIKRAAAKPKNNQGEGGKPDEQAKNSGFRHYYIKPPEAQTIDKITEFDPDKPALIAEDMVAAFAAPAALGGASGEEVLLTTWLVADGYKITDMIEKLDIVGYQAHYAGGNRLYLIAPDWGAEQTKELLNRIGTYKLNVTVLTLYGYSFNFESLRELENNLSQSLDKTVQIIKRY